MKADSRFLDQGPEFWTAVRLISEQLGYVHPTGKAPRPIWAHDHASIVRFFEENQSDSRVFLSSAGLSAEGELLVEYFKYRAEVLNGIVCKSLMDLKAAKKLYHSLKRSHRPKWKQVQNKQKGKKAGPAYLTCIVNMLLEKGLGKIPCDYDPQSLPYFTQNGTLTGMLSRRIDGALPSIANPVAVWEVKEYYHTKTFGSRVSDGIYESYMDGLELRELRARLGINVDHILILDAHFTWWVKGRSYLCRVIDMLHMGILGEALFGSEVVLRVPGLAKEWKQRLASRS